MRNLSNNRGLALVTVLLMSVIALSITAALIHFLLISTGQTSGKKNYKTATEAAEAAVQMSSQLLSQRGVLAPNAFTLSGINVSTVCDCNSPTSNADNNPNTCFCNKICDSRYDTNGNDNWPNCVANNSTSTIDSTNATTYDVSFNLGTAPNQYTAYFKIIDTMQGNTAASDIGLRGAGTVASNPGMANSTLNPFIYRIEILAQNSTNAFERARISILYAY